MSSRLTPPIAVRTKDKSLSLRKRGNDKVERAIQRLKLMNNAIRDCLVQTSAFLPPSPTKRTASPVKVPDQLSYLETPVHRQSLTKKDFENDPCLKDVEDLHSRIKRAMLLREIIPAEVRGDMESIDRESEPEDDLVRAAYERRFCEPVAGATAQARSRATFEMSLGLQQQAEECKELSRHEDGWNNLVHTPLLSHVFRDWRMPLLTQRYSSAVDPVWDDDVISEVYALLIEGNQTSKSSAGASVRSQSSINVNLATSHSRSSVKRVDYVVVMDIFEETGLKARIEEMNLFIWSQYEAPYHINQTAYKAVADSPIALSIETRRAPPSDEPLLQLGIWVAAWHKRMTYMRQLLVTHTIGAETEGFQQRLISVPLIQVIEHEWDMYFACFADKITLCGPVRMGSTASLVQLYALLASLEAVNAWIKTTFKKGMEEWFMCPHGSQL
ncbi:hypothetical protein GGR58DRAFT_519419 [Xylaria digitata]|nr:hypothetical protein GGR58DRAFT_519419 [Xylaria digitata]